MPLPKIGAKFYANDPRELVTVLWDRESFGPAITITRGEEELHLSSVKEAMMLSRAIDEVLYKGEA